MKWLKGNWSKLGLLLIFIFFLGIGIVNEASAHRSGCHRWHSCPSDSGSYTCGDAGYPCQYPTYPASGGVIYPPSGYYKDCYDCPLKKVPENSYTSGISFSCNSGYVKVGDACQKITVPSNENVFGAITNNIREDDLVKPYNDSTVFYIKNGWRNAFLSEEHLRLYDLSFSKVKEVSPANLINFPYAVAMYPIDTLFKTVDSDVVWLVTRQTDGVTLERKLIPDPTTYKNCFGSWNKVKILTFNNAAAGEWYGKTVVFPLCK